MKNHEINSDFGLFLKALEFAAIKHKDQRRKGCDKSPYINHPVQVARILHETGGIMDWNVLISAILHDTVEDTPTSKEEIAELFSPKIADIVMECTDDKNLTAERRKELQIINASHKTTEAKLVKIADKISNIGDIIAFPPENWSTERKLKYLDWAVKVVHGLRGINQELDDKFDSLIIKGRKRIGAK